MIYRVGNHNPALVYGEHDDAEFFTPPPAAEPIAVFVRREGDEHHADALHYVRAMNATMPICTCRVICYCGALVGTTSGCEGCMEHNGECIGADLGEALEQLIYMARQRGADDQLITHEDLELADARDAILRRFGWLGRYAS